MLELRAANVRHRRRYVRQPVHGGLQGRPDGRQEEAPGTVRLLARGPAERQKLHPNGFLSE